MANYECARCHRFFEKVAFEEVCPACFPVEEDEFSRIKEFLGEHPGASSNEVMQRTGVTLKSIKRYLKEDRLEIVGDNKGFIRCELCGKAINSGYFCEVCYKEGNAKKLKERELSVRSAYNSWKDGSGQNQKGIQYRDHDRDDDTKIKRINKRI